MAGEIPLQLTIDATSAKPGADATKQALKEVKTEARDTSKSVDGVGGSFEKMTASAMRMKIGVTAAIAAAAAATMKFATAAAEAEKAQLRVESVIRATGGTAGIAAQQLSRWASAMEMRTLFDDEAIKNAAAALLIYKNVQGETFERGITLAMDLASAMGTDLSSAAMMVGKALENPAENIGVLNRQLRVFTPAQIDAITAMQNAGDAAGAQAAALDTLQQRVGGTADTIANSLAGSLHIAATAFGDFFEETGAAIDGTGAFRAALDGIADAVNWVTEQSIKAFGEYIPNAFLEASAAAIKLGEAIGLVDKDIADASIDEAMERIQENTKRATAQAAEFHNKTSGKAADLAQGYKNVNLHIEKTPEYLKAAEEAEKKFAETVKKNLQGQWDFEERVRGWEKEALEEKQKAYEHLAENIHDAFADTFKDIAKNGIEDFADLADNIKNLMIDAAAEAAAAWATQQIMPSITGFIGGDTGSSAGGSAGSSVGGAATSAGASMAGSSAASALGMSAGMAAAVGAGLLIAAIALPKIIDSFKPRAHPASTFGAEIGYDNTLTNFDYRSKHMDTQYAQGVAGYVQGILAGFKASGTMLSGTVAGGVDDGRGFLSIAGKVVAQFDPSNESSVAGALASFTGELAKTSDVVNLGLVKAMQDLSTEGKTLQQVIEEINFQLTKDMLRRQFNAANVGALVAGASPEAAALMAEQARYKAAVTEATRLGANLDLVDRLHAQNVARIQSQYSTLNKEMEETVATATQLSQQYAGLTESLSAAIYGLKTGALSTLSPAEQYALAKQQFNAAASAASMGDANAMQSLPGLANDFLSASKAYNASTVKYGEDFDSVMKGLEAARATAQRQTDLQKQIADNTAKQLSATYSMEKTLVALQTSKAISAGNYVGGQFAADNANEIVVKNKTAIQKAGLMGTVNSLLDTYSFGVTPGDKRRSQFFSTNPEQNAAFIAAARALGIPGFASGGIAPVGRPYLVGERGPELRVDSSSSAIIPLQNNVQVLNEIRESNRHLSAAVVVLQAGFEKLSESTQSNSTAITRLADSSKRAGILKGA